MSMKIQSLGSVAISTASKINMHTPYNFEQVLLANMSEVKKAESDEAIFDELADKYDIRNATFEDVKEIGHAVYEAGVMTIKQLMILTFDYDRATQYIKMTTNGQASPNFTMYETASTADGKRDWIAEFTARATKDRQYGNLVGYANKNEIISILQLLEK